MVLGLHNLLFNIYNVYVRLGLDVVASFCQVLVVLASSTLFCHKKKSLEEEVCLKKYSCVPQ